jgi:hypothetical protein
MTTDSLFIHHVYYQLLLMKCLYYNLQNHHQRIASASIYTKSRNESHV